MDVVVNNFNYGRFLGGAIESALAQTHPSVRVIVVDDGSTDDSREIIASYGRRVVAVLKENGGQASALNSGFARCSGDIVLFLDADDLLEPTVAAAVCAAYTANPTAAKFQWRMAFADAAGIPSGRVRPPAHLALPQGDMRRQELAFPFDICWTATSGSAFPRTVLAEIMPIPEGDYRLGADSYLQHLTALLGPVVSLELTGTRRRLHDANGFEPSLEDRLELDHLHAAITRAEVTTVALEALADRLGYPPRRRPPTSVSDLGNRLISLRLDRARHVRPDDTRWGLARAGIRAAVRRHDVGVSLRIVFCVWFLAVASAPGVAVAQLGRWFVFPERRGPLGVLLSLLHRRAG